MVMLAVLSLALSLLLAASGKVATKIAPKARIIGGYTAKPTEFPYVALVSHYQKAIGWKTCTGSIISENYILTAAHCTTEMLFVQVYVGSNEFQEGLFFDISVQKDIKNYEHFNRQTGQHDISLIKTPKIWFKENIKPIRLPLSSDTYSQKDYLDESVIAVGWGMTSENALNMATKLQYIYEVVVPNSVCLTSYKHVYETDICVSRSDGKGPFKGDSGGPLILPSKSGEGPILIGVATAADMKACNRQFIAVYVRVVSYLKWIKNNAEIVE